MNIKRIIARCRRAKNVTILTDRRKHKFLSDGILFARLEDDTNLTPESIAEVIAPGIIERDKISRKALPMACDLTEVGEDAREIFPINDIIVELNDERYRVFRSQEGAVFVPSADMAILEDGQGVRRYYLKKLFGAGYRLVIAADGVVFGGTAPARVDTYKVLEIMTEMYEAAAAAAENRLFDAGGQMELR